MKKKMLGLLRRFIEATVLPIEPLRHGVYRVSYAIAHPIGLGGVAFLIWLNHRGDAFAWLFLMGAYYGFIGLPARYLRDLTRPAAEALPSVLPKENAWPQAAPVSLAVPPIESDPAESEAAMWARLDPQLHRIARPPSG